MPIRPPDATTGTLWQLRSYSLDQRVEPSNNFWFDNHHREKKGVCIFQYTLKGRMYYSDRHGERIAPAGWATMFAFGEESSYGLPKSFNETLLTQHVSLEGAGLTEHWNFIRERHGSVFHVGEESPVLLAMRQLCTRERPRSNAEAALHAGEVYAFLMRLYTYLDELWARDKPPVERAVDELVRQSTSACSLKEVAMRHGCSREHLTRVFSERTGTPPGAYLMRAKLKKALELLGETRLPIARVAEQCGFLSKHTLARQVRQQTNHSPAEYRRRQHARRTTLSP